MYLDTLILVRLLGNGSLYYKVMKKVRTLNGGYSTNYFEVSRGVQQGRPLSPLLFVLGVEVMAQKVRQSPECRGLKLP